MLTKEEIIKHALALPEAERMDIAGAIDASMAVDASHSGWEVEIDRRLSAYERGESQAVGAFEALDALKVKLLGSRH